MKVFLLHSDSDIDLESPLPAQMETVSADLGAATVLDAMAAGDTYLRGVAERVLFQSLTTPAAIRYRQAVLTDSLRNPDLIRDLYALAVRGVETRRDARFFWFRDAPSSLVQKSVGMLDRLLTVLDDVERSANERVASVESEGLGRLLRSLIDELSPEYRQRVSDELRELRFPRGTLVTASLGRGNRGTDYALRKLPVRRLLDRLTSSGRPSHSFVVSDRDEQGMESLSEIRDRGLRFVADAVAQATDHVIAFFATLRAELGFYVACLNLHDRLQGAGLPICMPDPQEPGEFALSARQLCDAALALHLTDSPVGNDLDADGRRPIIITGANQGGKSTFLRSVGLAQLMMQAGMFVSAERFRASTCTGLFTHFRREEDRTMTRGKLEEELQRMSEIADQIDPACMLLSNESFAATNEREGSEIGRQVIRAMTEAKMRVILVTHLYDLATSLADQHPGSVLFLRAERGTDGTRTFRVVPGDPLPTSYGVDSYRRIFGTTVGLPDPRQAS